MDETWYFARDGQRMGPFSFEQLKQMASSGVLNASDMLLRLGEQQWVPAKSVECLFVTGLGIAVAIVPENAQAKRSPPPEGTQPSPPQIRPAAGSARHPEGVAASPAPATALPPVPGLARAAGILWCAFGLLILLFILFTSEPLSAALVGFFGGAFIFIGIQTFGGWARDVLGNGIGSLIIVVAMMLGGISLISSGMPYAVAGVVMMVIGMPLVAAGTCALFGRDAYKKMRHEKERLMPTN